MTDSPSLKALSNEATITRHQSRVMVESTH